MLDSDSPSSLDRAVGLRSEEPVFNLIKGKDYVFNVGGSYICDHHFSKLLKIIPYANFIVGNGDEFNALARALGWSDLDLNQIIEKLANYNFDGFGHIKRTVFCTQVRNLALYATKKRITFSFRETRKQW